VSIHRWVGTTAAMGAVAWALRSVGTALPELQAAAVDPQGVVDRSGADALVLVVATALAWSCWSWGALGLLLTAASTAPGWSGRLARVVLHGVLPGSARRAAALALGVGLSITAPVVLPPAVPLVGVATAGTGSGNGLGAIDVDWPGSSAGWTSPDWPSAPALPGPAAPDPATPGPAVPPDSADRPAGEHVVLRGDCLWDIATSWLQSRQPGTPVPDADVPHAVQAWWQANSAVIGSDPDLLLPGQVLRPPP